MHYALPVIIEFDNICGVSVLDGETPFPDGSIAPVPFEYWSLPSNNMTIINGQIVTRTPEQIAFSNLASKYKKQVEGLWVEMTAEEKAIVDAGGESARQAAKPLALKTAENAFLSMCDQISGGTSHIKLGFAALEQLILQLPSEQQILVSVRLLAIDAELKREGGNLWWDDCAWHPELVG